MWSIHLNLGLPNGHFLFFILISNAPLGGLSNAIHLTCPNHCSLFHLTTCCINDSVYCCRVCFVASVPGSHKGPEGEKWGHRRLGHLLRKFAVIPSLLSPAASKESWPIIAQCSSIGTLGGDADSWMCGELRVSMSQKAVQPGDLPQPLPHFRVVSLCHTSYLRFPFVWKIVVDTHKPSHLSLY